MTEHARQIVGAQADVVEAARKDAEFDDEGCNCATHQALGRLDVAVPAAGEQASAVTYA